MLQVWLFPVLDVIVYPLFWVPEPIALTGVSALTGILMIWLYWLTSDQWRLAHEKRRIKRAQNQLFRGNYDWNTISDLIVGNGRMITIAFVPAVVTVLVILILIPWVGTRFGYYPPAVREPLRLQVTGSSNVSIETGPDVRHTLLNRSKTTSVFRLMALQTGRQTITLDYGTGKIPISFAVKGSEPPHWPDISRQRWYHSLVKPAGITLPTNGTIRNIHFLLTPVFGGLGITLLGTFLPGWLTYFFVVSFFVGIYFKFRYSIE
jgi:hypothetical protein